MNLTKRSEDRYTAFDGRLYLERRPTLSPYWYARTSFQSRQAQHSTKETDIRSAAPIAEQWFYTIHGQVARGELVGIGHTMSRAFQELVKHHRSLLLTEESNQQKIDRYSSTWNVIKPFFGNLLVSGITARTLEDFRSWRLSNAKRSITAKTIHADFVLVRQCLKRAETLGHLKGIPSFPTLKIKHVSPDWFDLTEYKKLLATSRARCRAVKEVNPHHYQERVELHAFILLMAHSCIRVDESLSLTWADIDEPKENKKLKFRNRVVTLKIRDGKVGDREALGKFGAIHALNVLRDLRRESGEDVNPSDLLFKSNHRQGFRNLLIAANLRRDSKGRPRNQKTLRHTSIMLRCLLDRHLSTAELAKVAGTSMETLERYYLTHLKTSQILQRYVDLGLERELLEAAKSPRKKKPTRSDPKLTTKTKRAARPVA